MFRNIVPREQSIDSDRGMTDESQLDLSKYQDPESDHSSDEDMEVEVVKTEEIANQKVFQYYNKALLIIMAVIISAVAIELLKPVTLKINNQEYTEMSTIYTTNLDDEQQEIAILMPNLNTTNRSVGQIINAEICIRHEAQDCWQEVLSVQGFMFVQVEKWVINSEIKGNVLILWEERLALSVLLLALNDQISGRIDVVVTAEHNRAYIQGLQVNLQRYQRQLRVNIIKKTVVVLAELREYHLVVGDQAVFDDIIYTSLLQYSVQRGMQAIFPQMVLEFIAKTNLMLFYEAPPSRLSKQKLQTIRNQITSIKISEDYEIMEHAIKDVNQTFNVIFLDSRIKDVEKAKPEKEKPIEQVAPKPVPEEDRPVIPPLEKLQPLKRLKRIDPQNIIKFFKCSTTNRDSAKVGQLYYTEIRRIQLIKQAGPSPYLNNTHFYNFILHLLVGSEPSNILDWCQDEMLANIAGSVHEGFVFIPDSNINLQAIKVTTYANKLRVNQVNNLGPDNFPDFVISNEIKVSCITRQHLHYMRKQFETALHSNMNIIMKMQGGEDEQILVKSLIQHFHVFVVSVHKNRQYDIGCIKNFHVSYYDDIVYPQHSYLFITKQDVLFEEVDGLDYFEEAISRNFEPTKYPCLREFTLKEAQVRYNMKKGSRELAIDSKVSIFVDGYVDPESVISAIKAQEGINQFLRTVLIVGDKIAVLGQTLQDPYTVANIIWMASGDQKEEVYFFNAPSSFQAYSDKLKQLNKLETIVEFMDFDWESEQFERILVLSGISVVISTPEIFSKIYKIAEKARGLLVLLKFQGSSKQLIGILDHFKEKQQYLVSEVKSRSSQYNLCLSHEIKKYSFKEMGEEAFENGGWIALTI